MKRRNFIKSAALAVSTAIISSNTSLIQAAENHSEKDKDSVKKAVSADHIFRSMPYLQNPTDNGITIMWQTHVPVYSWLEYGTDKNHLTKVRNIVDGQVICNDVKNKIRIENLQPGQTYYYRIYSQEILLYEAYRKVFGETAVSDFYTFTMPSAEIKDFTALILNDIHTSYADPKVLSSLLSQVKDTKYDFAIVNGDAIDDPATQDFSIRYLDYINRQLRAHEIPVFYIRGNHEIRNAYSIGLRNLFDYVDDKTYNAFNWGDTRFVTLDCGEDKPDNHPEYSGLNDFTELRKEQADFLEEELKSKAFRKAKRRVLVHHIPIYGKGREYDSYRPCRDAWHDVLKHARFDVSISGHTHKYSFHPKGVDGNNFPVIVGGGPNMNNATIMVLTKTIEDMDLKVLDTQGNILKDLKM